MKKRLLTLVAALALLFSLAAPAGAAAPAVTFSDVTPSHWYYEAVTQMAAAGYLVGYPDGTFHGRNFISLQEFVTALARQVGIECGRANGSWSGKQMAAVQELGWLNDADLALVPAASPITRQLAAKLMACAFALPDSHLPLALIPFTDSGEIGADYVDYVGDAYTAGIFQGDTQGNFYPQGNLRRGDAAILLWRAQELSAQPTAQEIMDYFVEVALYSEYDDQGNQGVANPLTRWSQPIYYTISGQSTPEDLALLALLMAEMNRVPGFPGLYPATATQPANLTIRFCSRAEMDYAPGYYMPYLDGFATIHWYLPGYNIYKGEVSYRWEGLEQSRRNSTLCEELFQAMGMLNDSWKYPDSVFYQGETLISWPSPLDWKMLELLYDPALTTGMSEQQCRQVLAQILN